jgi:hypothetical protein
MNVSISARIIQSHVLFTYRWLKVTLGSDFLKQTYFFKLVSIF